MDENHSKLLKALGKLLKDYFIFIVIIVATLVPFTRDRILNFLGNKIIPDEIIVKMTSYDIKSISINFFIAIVIVFILSIIITSILPYYIKNKLKTKIDELTNNGITSVEETRDEGIKKIGWSFDLGEKSLKLVRNSIKDELENTANLISAKIDENLYSYSILKKDMLNSQMVFVYGSLHYLKNDQSNDFLIEALSKNYWKANSSKYFILITQIVDDSIKNMFAFIKKIENGINGYNISADDFENFFISFRDVDPKIASPIQMVAFLNKVDTTKYSFKDNYTTSSIKEIKFSEDSSLNLKSKATGNDYNQTAKSCIGHTLVFSNDLINQEDVGLEKKIIGFKIPIKAEGKYEVLKEFDNLRKGIEYYKLSEMINCCIHCESYNIDVCVGRFKQLIKNNLNCENKNK